MKKRDYKNLAEGAFVHVYNRGNNREKIFHDKDDYRAFAFRVGLALGIDQETLQKESLLSFPHSRIRINAGANLFRLHSFCLMPNHFHLLLEQCGETEIAKIISQICTSYAMYVNKKHKRVGHVFQERYKAVIIESDTQLLWTSSYIHMNPVKANMVKNPDEYTWSSYRDFTKERNLPITHTDLLLEMFGAKDFEKEMLALYLKSEEFPY